MKTEKKAGYIYIFLEEEDFTLTNKSGEYIFRKIQHMIGEIIGNEYNEEANCWTVPEDKEKEVQVIYDTFFKNTAQAELFG